MTRVLLISKPLVPPWNDSGKNVARDIAIYATRTRFDVLTARGASFPFPAHVCAHPVYRASRTFGGRLAENARVAAHLLRPNDADIYHFLFAPNRVSSAVALAIAKLRPRKRTVQTVLSAPRSFETLTRDLFADTVVAVSRFAARKIPGATCIPPGVPIGAPPTVEERAETRARRGYAKDDFVVVYPGDYEFSHAADVVAESAGPLVGRVPGARVVFACRTKTEEAARRDAELRSRLAGVARIEFAGEISPPNTMRDLLLAADVAVLPADTTYAKIDLPIVLLEALEVGTPIVVGAIEPLTELIEARAGAGAPHGLSVDPRSAAALLDLVAALAADVARLAAMRIAARAVAVERFDARQMAASYEALYEAH